MENRSELLLDNLSDIIRDQAAWMEDVNMIKAEEEKDTLEIIYKINHVPFSEIPNINSENSVVYYLWDTPISKADLKRIQEEQIASKKDSPLLDIEFDYFSRKNSISEFRGESFLLLEEKVKPIFSMKYGYTIWKNPAYTFENWDNNDYVNKNVHEYEHRYICRLFLKNSSKEERKRILDTQRILYSEKVAKEVELIQKSYDSRRSESSLSEIEFARNELSYLSAMRRYIFPKDIYQPLQTPRFGIFSFSFREMRRLTEDFELLELGKPVYKGFSKHFFYSAATRLSLVENFEAESFWKTEKWLLDKIQELSYKPVKRKKLKSTFINWVYSKSRSGTKKEQITFLFQKLIEKFENFEFTQITFDSFYSHFQDGDTEEFPWSESNTLLTYFFEKMALMGCIPEEQANDDLLISNHFRNRKGRKLTTSDLSSARNSYKDKIPAKPKKFEIIDQIFEDLDKEFPKKP